MNKKYEMLVLDLDGTLLTDDKRITAVTAKSVAECRRRGIKVILASARPPRSTRFASEILELDEPVINYNGSLIQNPVSEEILLHKPIPRALALELLEAIKSVGTTLVPSVEIMDHWYTERIVDGGMYKIETAKAGFKPNGVGPLEGFIDRDVTKIFTLGAAEDLARVDRLVADRYKDRLITTRSDDVMTQIMDAGAGKVAAVDFLTHTYSIAMDHVAAMGDNHNDADLLRAVGLGIAMANAPEEVRVQADRVTRSNQDDGVAWAIEQWILGDSV